MAEFLIQARDHWMENLSQAEIDALKPGAKITRDRRIAIGDLVVIKPDGWVWGNEEKLPYYIVIKAPGVAVEDVNHLTGPLMEAGDPEDPELKMIKTRKYQIPQGWMNTHLDQDVVVLSPAEIALVMDNIVEKTP